MLLPRDTGVHDFFENMKANVKYLRSEIGILDNSKFLDRESDKIFEFKSAIKRKFIEKDDKGSYKILNKNVVPLIPYAVNNEYELQETVYCFDTIFDIDGNERRGFFATLLKINEAEKNMFGIQPLIANLNLDDYPDKLYWSNEIVNIVGTIHPKVNWIKAGNKIEVSRTRCNINQKLRIFVDLKVKCPTCGEFHPHD